MKRRTYLARAGVVLSGVTLAGCSGGSDDGEAGGDAEAQTPTPTPTATPTPEPTPTPTTTPTPTATPEAAVKIERALVIDKLFPRELEAGSTLRYDIDVREGGGTVLAVLHQESGESVLRTTVRTSESGQVAIEKGGTYSIVFNVGGKTEVSITVR